MSCKRCIGITCHCNRGEPCLLTYQVDSKSGSLVFQSGRAMGKRTLEVMDEGSGADIVVSLEGFCESGLAQCPAGYLTDHNTYAKAVSTEQCRPYQLRHQSDKEFGLLNALKFILAENKLTQLPHTTYQLCITQCAGKPQQEYSIIYSPHFSLMLGDLSNDCFIHVYPKTEIESNLTLSYKSASEKVEDEVRYKEYFERQRNGTYQGEAIPEKEITRSFSLEGSLAIKQGTTTTTYATGLETNNSNFTYHRNLQTTFNNIVDQWRLINGIIDIISQIKQGTYQNTGKGKVKVVSVKLGTPNVTLKGKQTCELIDSTIGTSGELALNLSPLFSLEVTLDLVLAAAAYFKLDNAVGEIRTKAEELEKKVKAGHAGAYVGAEFFIKLSSTLDTEGTIKQSVDAPTDYDLSAVTDVTLSSDINLRGGAKVWVVEGAFQMTGRIITKCFCAIRSKIEGEDSSVELVFFHEGIKAIVTIKTSARIQSEDGKSTQGDGGWGGQRSGGNAETSVSYSEEREWQWVPELREVDSTYRTKIIGNKT